MTTKIHKRTSLIKKLSTLTERNLKQEIKKYLAKYLTVSLLTKWFKNNPRPINIKIPILSFDIALKQFLLTAKDDDFEQFQNCIDYITYMLNKFYYNKNLM